MAGFSKSNGGLHADTATERARTIGLPKVENYLNQLAKYAERPKRYRTEGGTTKSGAPMRSIKESLVNRGPGKRAASSYLSATRPAKAGLLKTMAKTAGRVGARLAGPVGIALTAYDAVDTVRTAKETIGAARELGKVRAEGRAAEQGAAAIRRAMKNKYPLANSNFASKPGASFDKSVVKIGKGQRKDRQSVITGIKVN